MWQVIGVLRVLGALPVLVFGLVVSPFIPLMSKNLFRGIARRWYRCLLWTLGIRYRYEGVPIDSVGLVVCNHISWADILVLGARYPYLFLAMREVASWPVVGGLASRAGTLFIKRGRGGDDAIATVAGALEGGESVIIFPEGRTSLGVSTSRFHAKIFESAVAADVPVYPVALFYQDGDRSADMGSRVTFADEAGFVAGIWRTVCGPAIDATVRVFPALPPSLGRHELAKQSSGQISEFVKFTVNSSV